MKILGENISVIVQGPIDHSSYNYSDVCITQQCISSIRNLLPNCTIILSTWKNQNTLPIQDYDVLLENEDPKGQSSRGSLLNNVNRQIVSTCKGLELVKTKYCLKIRTDIILTSLNFLEYFHFDDTAINKNQFFKAKIISNNLTTRNPNAYHHNGFHWKLLFHISDHVHFGFKEDLIKLWDIPLQSNEDALYFLDRAFPENFKLNEYARFTPEQYITTEFLKKFTKIDFDHYADWSPQLESLSESLLLSNFTFVSDAQYSFNFPKYHIPLELKYEALRYNETSKITSVYEEKSCKTFNPLISIIIPAYKSLPYIEYTVESILTQSYDNFELIIVRNGSYVDLKEDLYFNSVLNNSKIKVISLKDAGANIARKKGLEVAQGDYIYIMDADDLLSKNALELITNNIKTYNSDCIVLGFSIFESKGEHSDSKIIAKSIPNLYKNKLTGYRVGKKSEVIPLLSTYNHTFWCYVFKKGIIKAEFINTDTKYYEEIQSLLSCFISCNTISILPAIIYQYRQGTSSQLTSGWVSNNRISKIEDLAAVILNTNRTAKHANKVIKNYYIDKILNITFSEIYLSEDSSSANQELIYKKLQAAINELKITDYATSLGLKNFFRLYILKKLSRCSMLKIFSIKNWCYKKIRFAKNLILD